MGLAAYANLSLYLFPYTNYASPTDDNEQGYRQFKGPINDAQGAKKASIGSFTTKKDVRQDPYVLPLSLLTLANASMNIRWAQMKASLCNFDRDASTPEMCSYLSMPVMVWSPARHSRPNKVDHLDESVDIVTCDFKIILDTTLHECLVDPLPADPRHSGAILDLDRHVNLATGSSTDTPDPSDLGAQARTWRHSTVPDDFSGVVTAALALARLRTRLVKKHVPDADDIAPRTPGIIPRPPCGGWYCAILYQKALLPYDIPFHFLLLDRRYRTWEDSQNKGKSMTTKLIKILKKNPSIKVGDLDQQLKKKLSKMAFKRLSPELRKKWEDEYTEKGLFQLKEKTTQIGSMHRLRRDEVLIAKRSPSRTVDLCC
ncbi:hypothetical protein H4582DRAFT_2076518 [Lactarius indigo]|nr:hypothetical protein H4582DRAFT_2076518 [Lactarius indigo]